MVLLGFSRLHRHGEDCQVGSCPGDDHWQPAPGDTEGWASYQDQNPSTVVQKSKVLSPDEKYVLQTTAGLQLVSRLVLTQVQLGWWCEGLRNYQQLSRALTSCCSSCWGGLKVEMGCRWEVYGSVAPILVLALFSWTCVGFLKTFHLLFKRFFQVWWESQSYMVLVFIIKGWMSCPVLILTFLSLFLCACLWCLNGSSFSNLSLRGFVVFMATC